MGRAGQDRREVEKKKPKTFLEKRAGQKVKDWNNDKIGKAHPQKASTPALGNLLNDVDSRQAAFERAMLGHEVSAPSLKRNVNKEAENTRRSFFKELRKVLEAADVIVQVLDARDPASCRSAVLEAEVLAGERRLVLVLNKIDLVPLEACTAWLHHLKRDFPTIAFKAARSGTQRGQYVQSNVEAAYASGVMDSQSGVVGAEDLMQLLKNYARTRAGSKMSISVGIVGYPNVGKSSVINSLKRSCVVKVGGTAGVTKCMQEVQLDSKVRLIDCPGVVFDGASDDPSVVLRSAVNVENLSDPVEIARGLIQRFPRSDVENHFGVTLSQGPDYFLTKLAQSRGKLKRGGVVCHDSAARLVLVDMMQGRFRYYCMPPVLAANESVKVVTEFAPEFKLDDDDDEMGVTAPCVLPKQAPTRRAPQEYLCDMSGA